VFLYVDYIYAQIELSLEKCKQHSSVKIFQEILPVLVRVKLSLFIEILLPLRI